MKKQYLLFGVVATLFVLLGMSQQSQKSWSSAEQQRDLANQLKKAQIADYPTIVLDFFTKKVPVNVKELWSVYGVPFLKQQVLQSVMAGDPNRDRVAQVYTPLKSLQPLASLEGAFLAARAGKIKNSLERLTGGGKIDFNELPTLACCMSGGGYRAMVLTAGFMQALEEIGLLDAITYVSALSGSTWYIGPWTLMQTQPLKPSQYNGLLEEKIQAGTFNLKSAANQKSFSLMQFTNDIFFPKTVFGQIIGSVDLYGALLAHALLADFGDLQLRQRLSHQQARVKDGNVPWPLYTAVSMMKNDPSEASPYLYNWFEFSPEEIRNLETNLTIPSFSFGRKFDNGASVDFAPEQSFGFLMGIFGSAYTVNLADMIRIMNAVPPTQEQNRMIERSLAEKESGLKSWFSNKLDADALKLALVNAFLKSLSEVKIGTQDERNKEFGTLRVAPAQVNNPFKGYRAADSWLRNRETITFVDAGIHYNLPVRPLMRPDRGVNLIFICDASADAYNFGELKKLFTDVNRFHKITYAKDVRMSTSTFHVYRPSSIGTQKAGTSSDAPIIVYMNFFIDETTIKKAAKDTQLKELITQHNLDTFNMRQCTDAGYCGTFNFSYGLQDFRQLSAVARLVVRAHRKQIVRLVQEVILAKQEAVEFGGGL
jgi:phospholipase A2